MKNKQKYPQHLILTCYTNYSTHEVEQLYLIDFDNGEVLEKKKNYHCLTFY